MRRGAWHGAPGPFVTILRLFQPPQQLSRAFPGRNSRTTQTFVIRGIFFPPKAQQKSSAQQAQGHVVMPSRPCPGPYSSSPTSLFSVSNSMRHREPPTYARVSNGDPPEPSSSGVRCRPGSGGRRPKPFAGLAPPGYPHPLGAEAPRPLGSLRHHRVRGRRHIFVKGSSNAGSQPLFCCAQRHLLCSIHD